MLPEGGMNKFPLVLGVIGCVALSACGKDEGDGDDGATDSPLYNVDHGATFNVDHGATFKVLDNPAYEIADGVLDNPTYGNQGTNPLYRGATREDVYATRFEYTLHGTDADINTWLRAGDVIMQRSPAGGLTYAVVRTLEQRDLPAQLIP